MMGPIGPMTREEIQLATVYVCAGLWLVLVALAAIAR